ncbi:LysE family translocator [Roseovarius sp. EL26]|uniref:LysE family translocator n=1 Tax=Roseovarius sp. EL26 TaxID=2126672 RepID=UPI000EA07A66|nr:LysE family translocator [Roseovarius sp. EL26]
MAWSEIAAFVFVAALLVMSPGPNGFLIAKTVPTSGRAAGFANVAGFVTAFFLHGALAILGISIILVKSATAFAIVKYIGAAYLIWIGLKALFGAFKSVKNTETVKPAQTRRTLWRAYMEGFFTNALNPKVSMFYLAAFPQFITVGETSAASSFLLVFLHSMVATAWFTTMTLLFSKLTSMARSGSFQRWLKGVTGVVFIGFGLKLASFKASI